MIAMPPCSVMRAIVSMGDRRGGTGSSRNRPRMWPDVERDLLADDDLEVVHVLEGLREQRALDGVVIGDRDDLEIGLRPGRSP